ncbi:hypothetical protein P170DRAFT_449171 [Aspergillus steynii IBT 23096]|uniref:Zn(2)-C6 fungal-type domain-containing protein n=1 Tax=Aspergillus steynii IBT 23096 TaxID=1392250 RepID=A0A2I2FXX0_9EURO|nr:uncharacterized protein P170DRAFT_449171 [Aspergillus steynii IBT 23096]PLB45480.1 hypothetical protein P170DRAFT_449171 [Aspergillus steynii IBT 23096]
MTSRLAACEVCRKAKLACDHKWPTCTRCENSNKTGICIYRVAPFKRKRPANPSSPEVSKRVHLSGISSSSFNSRPSVYPNPGYLGSSSHATIFEHISLDESAPTGEPRPSDLALSGPPCPQLADDGCLLRGADILRQLLNSFPLTTMNDLVMFWLAKGANLALAEPFTKNWHLAFASRLLRNSAQPLEFASDTSLSDFMAQFVGNNLRWEALGIFFSAVNRATYDIPFFPRLYMTREEQYALRQLCTRLSDASLKISLSLDCLNDLQLILQYENFIIHSNVDGAQSYHPWRKLGDVMSSMFALGYHENVETKTDAPPFLMKLRKTAFARVYSADKNIAIFLGRPPRMSKRFCHFQIPSSFPESHGNEAEWNPEAKPSYTEETRWSALCASLKEEILELARDKQHACEQKLRPFADGNSAIQDRAEAQWRALPPQFRLEGSIRQYNQRSPFERDFLISARLNQLHVLFLLRLLLLDTLVDPDTSIVIIAGEMLALVVEIILIRDQLTNSGTGLIWKIAHYGLPAAGIVLLAMLKQRTSPLPLGKSRTKILQDLSIFVAEIQIGAIVIEADPIYGLITKATQTIQRFLESFYSEPLHPAPETTTADDHRVDDWASVLGQDLWDFESGFWQNLADHPSLMAFDSDLTEA